MALAALYYDIALRSGNSVGNNENQIHPQIAGKYRKILRI